jgi:serralysin
MEQGYDDMFDYNNQDLIFDSNDDLIDGGTGIDNIMINHNFADMTMGVNANGTVVIKDANGNVTTITDVENFTFSDQSFDVVALQANNDVRPLFASPQLENGTWVNQYLLPDEFSAPGNPGLEALYDYQYYGDNTGNILVASDKNDFINGFGGDDAINTGAGNDIIDGGLGSNFLTGGSGNDTFFSDGREAGNGAITWSTVTDFTDGTNSVNIWGYVDGTSTYQWYADQGAAGWTGATLHADLDGNGVIDTSITFTGMTESQLTVTGHEGAPGYFLIV